MIVYTATDEINHTVYVGSAREDLEEHWISLVNQAEGGADGDFFEAIRKQGANKFEIEEFGYAEDSSEMRELMREAQSDLGAIPIKAGRASVIGSKAKVVTAKSDLDELMSLDASSGSSWSEDSEDDFWLEARREEKAKETDKPAETVAEPVAPKVEKKLSALDLIKQELAEAALATGPVKKPRAAVKKAAPAPKAKKVESEAKIASGRTGSASKERRIKEAIQQAREDREQFRQTESTAEAEEMKNLMMGIEARRLAARQSSKNARLAEAKKKAAAERKAAAAEKKSEAARLKSLKSAAGERPEATGRSSKASIASVDTAPEVEDKPVLSKRDSRAEAKLLAAKVLSARAPKPAAPAVVKDEVPAAVQSTASTTAPEPVDEKAPKQPKVTVKAPRASAASREKRIKDAIAAEKARIDEEKRARINAETPEMTALLAGLDARSKVAESYKRKR